MKKKQKRTRRRLTVTGNVQVKGGKWYCVLNLYENGKRKVKWIGTGLPERGNKRAAQEILKTLCDEYTAREKIKNGGCADISVVLYIKEMLPLLQRNVAKTTAQNYDREFRSRIEPYFSSLDITMSELKPKHIQQFYDGMTLEGLKGTTVQHYHVLLHLVFKQAVKRGALLQNPCDMVDKPKKEKYNAQFYNAEHVHKLLDAAKDDPLRDIIEITTRLGVRRSELVGLRWSNIDFKNKKIHIHHKVVKLNNGEFFCSDILKNQSSRRTLPLRPDVERILLAIKANCRTSADVRQFVQ